MKNLPVRITDIPESGILIEREESPEVFPILKDLEKTGECKFISPIKLSVEVKAIGQIYRMSGSYKTDVQLYCSRCLSEFNRPLSEAFDMTFARSIPDTTDEGDFQGKELTADEIEMTHFDGEEIDLKDALQQQFIMSLSQRPLCEEACKGLCQKCGANLNDGDCRCEKDQINGRFEILKGLKLDK
ncbi:MAG TPA: DUF177 domain-containing protein [Deltaproteobacteria bacterium]|nr:DUF177 domain-containing protein [Deltaproteobacteria bacterium]